MKTLILDNYDSFTYNLYQYVAELGGEPVVYRNDEITVEDIATLAPTHIIISPGPGHPKNEKDFGVCRAVIEELGSEVPILGVCLGHQGMAMVFGGEIVHAPEIVHGKISTMKQVEHKDLPYPSLVEGISETFGAMRYHSLMADRDSFSKDLVVTVETEQDSLIMALQHKEFPMYGIQFHPESIGTEVGKTILKNFLKIT